MESLGTKRAQEWDAYVRHQDGGTVFHSLSWKRAVERTYSHRSVYLAALRADRIVGCLPLFHVKSLFLGSMLISVPYAVGGGILADDEEAVKALFHAARNECSARKCRSVELRSERAIVAGIPVVDRYVGFQRALPRRPEEVLGFLPRKARAAARQARERFELSIDYGDEHVDEVWALYARSMKRLASPVYPLRFLKALVEETPGRHWVSRVRWNGATVAGLITFLFRDRVLPYFIGTTDAAKSCHAANFVYLCTMERAAAEGFRIFDFGRSRRDNQGSYDFKRFQGFEPRPLGYQTYCPPGVAPPASSPSSGRYALIRGAWRCLPLPVANFLGVRLAHHFPG